MIKKLQQSDFEEINKRLEDKYGRFDDNRPYFRLIWSEDLLEKRWMTHTDEGFQLLHPEVREVPKYRHYIRERYILEGLREIPNGVESDLTTKISYEPIWTFESNKGEYLIPIWPAIHHILETVRANMEGNGNYAKYKDPDSDPKQALENERARIDELEKTLFGNETPITDALSHRSGVGYGPGSQPNSSIVKEN